MRPEEQTAFLRTAACCAAAAAALYLLFRYLLWWLLPFLLAFGAARAIEPAILFLQRTVRFRRGFSAALLTLFLLFLLGGLLSLLLSALFAEASAFLTQLPSLLDALPAQTAGLVTRLREYGALCPLWMQELLSDALTDWTDYGNALVRELTARMPALLGSLAAVVPGLVLFAATTFLAVFFVSSSYPALCAQLRGHLSPRTQQCLHLWRSGITLSLARWLRAQALLCFLTFCQLLLGFWLLGDRFSLLAAFLITLVDALPVFGTGTVLIPWALAELLLGTTPRGIALLLLYLCTLTTRSIAEPHLVAAQAGLPPIASLAAMYFGARSFGVAGMILFPLLLLFTAQVVQTKKEGSL